MLYQLCDLLDITVNCTLTVPGQKRFCYQLVLCTVILIEVEKYCDLSSVLTALSNLFVQLGIDKCLVLIQFYGELLLLPVVTCSVGFKERGGTTNGVFGDE